MNEQPSLYFPLIGNSWAVGLAFQVHLIIVAFIMGIAIIAPTAELLGRRNGGGNWARLARDLAGTITRFFSFGATWAVLALVLIFGLFPGLFGTLTSIFFWPLLVIAGVWFVMTITAYLYYHTWMSLGQGRWSHMAIGWAFAGSAFVFISLITQISSYQLTPTQPTSLLAAALNPSWPPEIIHRQIGNLSYAGLILAGYAGIQNLFARESAVDRAYHDWLGHLGILLGTGFILLQPIGGWFYARQVQIASPGAYERMMIGENSWMFLAQSFFLGLVFFFGNFYLASAAKRGDTKPATTRLMKSIAAVVGLLALLLIVPKEWPLGQMKPWKYISLGGLVLLSLTNMVLYLRARRSFVWGRVDRGSQAALAMIGVSIVALIITMGVIRTSARGGEPIYLQPEQNQIQQVERQ